MDEFSFENLNFDEYLEGIGEDSLEESDDDNGEAKMLATDPDFACNGMAR